jgi:type II secretory pathway predicted ATPase ExeA
MENKEMIQRQTELTKAIEAIAKGQHTLLIGEVGVGKSHLLRETQSKVAKAIYIESISPLKSALLDILKVLHQNDDLQAEGIEAEYLTWEELLKKLNRRNIKELEALIQQNLGSKGYVLLLDHLETATPSMVKKIEVLMEQTTILAAANQRKPSLKKLWWRFEAIEIPPLTTEESRQLLWQLIDETSVADPELLERKILTQANGNPLAIVELAQKAGREGNLTPESIRGLRHSAGDRFIDITPIFFIIGALVIAARFIALGTNSTELYILAGVAGGFFMGLRYFLYRSMRGNE